MWMNSGSPQLSNGIMEMVHQRPESRGCGSVACPTHRPGTAQRLRSMSIAQRKMSLSPSE